MPNSLRTTIIVIVAAVWAINFTAPVFVTDYKPAPELNVAFMAIIGVLTASYRREDDSGKATNTKLKRHKEIEEDSDQ